MTFEEACARLRGTVLHAAADVLSRNKDQATLSKDELQQEGWIWIWEHLGDLERWQAEQPKASGSLAYTSIHRFMTAYAVSHHDDVASLEALAEKIQPEFASDTPVDIAMDYLGSPLDVGHGPEATYCDCEANQFVYPTRVVFAAIEKLPEKKREMILAYFVDGKSFSQIARDYGVHVSYISREIQRLVQKIREEAGERLTTTEPDKPKPPIHSCSEGYGKRA